MATIHLLPDDEHPPRVQWREAVTAVVAVLLLGVAGYVLYGSAVGATRGAALGRVTALGVLLFGVPVAFGASALGMLFAAAAVAAWGALLVRALRAPRAHAHST